MKTIIILGGGVGGIVTANELSSYLSSDHRIILIEQDKEHTMGNGKAGYAGGNFYGSPLPVVKMKNPGFFWHWTKVWFEKHWFFKYF